MHARSKKFKLISCISSSSCLAQKNKQTKRLMTTEFLTWVPGWAKLFYSLHKLLKYKNSIILCYRMNNKSEPTAIKHSPKHSAVSLPHVPTWILSSSQAVESSTFVTNRCSGSYFFRMFLHIHGHYVLRRVEEIGGSLIKT